MDVMDVEMEDLTGVPVQEPQPLSGLVVPGSDGTPPVMVIDENPCETLYIQNLNEKVKPQGVFLLSFQLVQRDSFVSFSSFFFFLVMKATLRGLFKSYGEVLDVTAHHNLRMRGQAFVSFASIEQAKKAMKDIQRFPLYSKPMVRGRRRLLVFDYLELMVFFQQISFAKTRSDAVVKRLDDGYFEEHKRRREDRKSAPFFCSSRELT